ncbi:hypothetical protein HI914_05971 [Erysiphe necator]|nr:hypothetical protein HI914_05971 [Erysiphe necator]
MDDNSFEELFERCNDFGDNEEFYYTDGESEAKEKCIQGNAHRRYNDVEQQNIKAKTSVDPFPVKQDPFPTFGAWIPEHKNKLNVVIPSVKIMTETTNDFTRKKAPKCRYWKHLIEFHYQSYSSYEIRLNNIKIPYFHGEIYAKQYVFMCLPMEIGSLLMSPAKGGCKLQINDQEILPSLNWWKYVNGTNGVADKFGIVDPMTRIFSSRDLASILKKTKMGIEANVILKFWCKASTTNNRDLSPSDVRTVGIELVRAYITKIKQDVSLPPSDRLVGSIQEVTRADLADKDLLAELKKLDLN